MNDPEETKWKAMRELEAFNYGMLPIIQGNERNVSRKGYGFDVDRLKKYLVRFSDAIFYEEKIKKIPVSFIPGESWHNEKGRIFSNYKKLDIIIHELLDYIREKGVNINAVFEDTEINSVENMQFMLKYEQENNVILLNNINSLEGELSNKINLLENAQKRLDSANSMFDARYKAEEDAIRKMQQIEKNSIEELSIAKSEAEEVKKEFSDFKEKIQKKEISDSSNHFRLQEKASKYAANLWMAGIFLSFLLFSILLYVFIMSNNNELFNVAVNITAQGKMINQALTEKLIMIEIAKKISLKLFIFSMAIYFISFLLKNYNAQMHNYIINAQKANALRSTVELIGTAKQDEGNDKIILQATEAIFTTQKSGYQGVDSEPTSPSLITNVIDAVGGGKKPA